MSGASTCRRRERDHRHAQHGRAVQGGGFTDEQARALTNTQREWAESNLATKDDLKDLNYEVKQEIAELRTEVAEVRTELRTEIASVRAEMGKLGERLTSRMVIVVLGINGAFTAAILWSIGRIVGPS